MTYTNSNLINIPRTLCFRLNHVKTNILFIKIIIIFLSLFELQILKPNGFHNFSSIERNVSGNRT